jgi:sarcosine oxidase subunit alpha
MTTDLRIADHPHLTVERGRAVAFEFNGKPVTGYTGETIAAALYAGGLRIFSRSFKYHRPRSLFCLEGHCSNCLMRVNGIPNVRICTAPVRAGLKVESQNAWPSLNFDVAAISGYLDFLIRPGFQYRRFIRPRWAYHIWEKFLRHMAGIGKLSDIDPQTPPRMLDASPDVAVVGAGMAGLAAALHASQAGAQVWLIEKEDQPGGRIRWDTTRYDAPQSDEQQRGFSIAKELTAAVEQIDNCRVLTGATAFAWYDEDILAVVRQGELWALKPQRIIVAAGSYDNPMVFENNDLPGIFLAGGLQRLMHRDFIRPGTRAVVATDNGRGYDLAQQLVEAGVAVAAVIDSRPQEQALASDAARQAGDAAISIYPGYDIDIALGRRHLKGVRIKPVDTETGAATWPKKNIDCDVLGIAGPRTPATELIFQRTSQGQYILESPNQFTRRPVTSDHLKVEADMYVAGGAGGSRSLKRSWLEGRVAGLSAALDLGLGDAATKRARHEAEAMLADFKD